MMNSQTVTRYVAYYRVSTHRQGQSGLGLEAQQAAVQAFVAQSQPAELVESYTEVESGKRADRPQLALAVAACKRLGAVLVIAKLDRLARNVHFVSGLMESKVDFVAVDNPTANRLTVHILAAVAEDEARRISERTKSALAAAKAQGRQLGNPVNLTTDAAQKGNRANAVAAEQFACTVRPIAVELRGKGRTLLEIAETLTGRGLLTRRGKAWTPTAVGRLLQ